MHRYYVENLFHVPRIMCEVCVTALSAAVWVVDTAARVEANLEARTVRVVSHAYEATLLRVLREAGFRAEPILQPIG